MPYAVPITWCEVKDDKGNYCSSEPTHTVYTENGCFVICTHHADVYSEAKFEVKKFKRE